MIDLSKASNGKVAVPLPGEDIASSRWGDCRHWIAIYAGLLQFKAELLEHIKLELLKLPPEAQRAASVDLIIVGDQRARYQQRLELWYQRVWDLMGLWVDPDGGTVRYGANKVSVTVRERQLLEFLIRHPHQEFTSAQILTLAWPESGLHDVDVENHVGRLRQIVRTLALPCSLVARSRRGYSLVLNTD